MLALIDYLEDQLVDSPLLCENIKSDHMNLFTNYYHDRYVNKLVLI